MLTPPYELWVTKKPTSMYIWRVGLRLQLAKRQLREIHSHNNIRQHETLQSERLARERLGEIGLELRLPNDIIEYLLPFPNCTFYTTT
jgi:hypothetical protein